MKKKIHPTYGTIEIVRTDGSIFEIQSCLSAKFKKYHLEIDPKDHPAWSKKDRFTGLSIGNIRKFEQQYPVLELK